MLPDSATSATDTFCCLAINPRAENTATPPNILVLALITATIRKCLKTPTNKACKEDELLALKSHSLSWSF